MLDPTVRARLERAIHGRYLLQHQDIRAALDALDTATQTLGGAEEQYAHLNGEYLWLMDRATRLEQTALAAEEEVERLRNLPSQLDRAVIRENGKLRAALDATTEALGRAELERNQYRAVVQAAHALCSCTGAGQYVERFADVRAAVAALPAEPAC